MSGLLDSLSWQRKFARAQHHLQTLADEWIKFLATNPYETIEQIELQDDGSLRHSFLGLIRDKPPATWEPIIGDCLNNLRASLDHMTWALACGRGSKTAFPIFTEPNDFKRLAPRRHLRYVPGDEAAFIETLQPYNHVDGPKAHLLFLLDRLTNDDKHRELLGTEVGIAHIHVDAPVVGELTDGDLLKFTVYGSDYLFKNGATIFEYVTSNPEVQVPLHFTFDVAFDPEGPAGAWPFMSGLVSLSFAVSLVLREFEVRFLGRTTNLTPPPLEGIAGLRGG